MSANDAIPTGEVGKEQENKKGVNFDSPNITHASADVSEPVVDAKEEARKAAQKKAETVAIDGVPIDEKDVKYKSDDIAKDGGKDYFVNIDQKEVQRLERRRLKKVRHQEHVAKAKEDAKARRNSIDRLKYIAKWPFANVKRGTITCAIVALLICGAIAAFIISIQPKVAQTPPNEVQDFLFDDADHAKSISSFLSLTADYNPDDVNSYAATCLKIEEEIAKIDESDVDTLISYKTQYTAFILRGSDDIESALKNLEGLEEIAETDYQKSLIYNMYIIIGMKKGDVTMQNTYNEKMQKLNLPSQEEIDEEIYAQE